MNIRHNYDKEHDILGVSWELGVDYSEEITSSEGHEFVIDYDKKGRIIGIEIFDWDKGNPAKHKIKLKKKNLKGK